MNRLKKRFTLLITGVIVLSLSSCTSLPTSGKSDTTPLSTAKTLKSLSGSTEEKTQPLLKALASQLSPSSEPLSASTSKATSTVQPSKTVTLRIYQADSQCQNLVSQKVAVPAGSPANAVVGKVLQQADSGDFDLGGYRVNINAQTGVATVDLRRLPSSQRQFISLSACEQFALFGSLRKTLIANSQLKIKDVRFTEQGRTLQF